MPKPQRISLAEKINKNLKKLFAHIFENHTSTIAVIGAMAGGHMIGSLPDLETSDLPITEMLAWLPLIALTLAMLFFNYFYERASFSKDIHATVKYRSAIVCSSIILSLANYYSPYNHR